MAVNAAARVEGLREFQRTLRRLPNEVKVEVKATNRVLAEVVAAEARVRANARPRKTRTYTLAPRIRARSALREPTIVVLGHPRKRGSRGSDAKVQEFGGRAPLFGNRSKWFDVRPRQKGGYFLYPAVKAKRDVINKGYLDALDKALRRST